LAFAEIKIESNVHAVDVALEKFSIFEHFALLVETDNPN